MIAGRAQQKPAKIDFFVWEGDFTDINIWLDGLGASFQGNFVRNLEDLHVRTLEGSSYAVPLNYVIIRGVEGEFYPCESKIFHKTYQRAKEEGLMVITSGDMYMMQNR